MDGGSEGRAGCLARVTQPLHPPGRADGSSQGLPLQGNCFLERLCPRCPSAHPRGESKALQDALKPPAWHRVQDTCQEQASPATSPGPQLGGRLGFSGGPGSRQHRRPLQHGAKRSVSSLPTGAHQGARGPGWERREYARAALNLTWGSRYGRSAQRMGRGAGTGAPPHGACGTFPACTHSPGHTQACAYPPPSGTSGMGACGEGQRGAGPRVPPLPRFMASPPGADTDGGRGVRLSRAGRAGWRQGSTGRGRSCPLAPLPRFHSAWRAVALRACGSRPPS